MTTTTPTPTPAAPSAADIVTAIRATELAPADRVEILRALRETTRLGASPYSMWRDVAMTNTEAIADTLLALEQRLAHMRENLRTPELREEFAQANKFRARHSK